MLRYESNLSSGSVFCTELLVKDYKNLLKCLFGEEVKDQTFVDGICTLLSTTTNISKDCWELVDITDLFCLLLDIRINSIGEICAVNVTLKDKKVKVQLNLNLMKKTLLDLTTKAKKSIICDDFKIKMSYPSFVKLKTLSTENYYLSFIESIKLKDKRIVTKTNQEAEALFDRLPVKVSLKIIEKAEQMYNDIISLNFFKPYNLPATFLNFVPSISNLIWYVKLLFEEPLDIFYKNFFYMSYYGHMDSTYLENLSVGEYNFFVNCLRAALNPESSDAQETSQFDDADNVDKEDF